MGKIPRQCPHCGANIHIDELYETGACPYCDSVLLSREKIREAYEDRHKKERKVKSDVEALLVKGLQYEVQNKPEKALDCYSRILELEPKHSDARAGIQRLRGAAGEQAEETAFTKSAPLSPPRKSPAVKPPRIGMWVLAGLFFMCTLLMLPEAFSKSYYIYVSIFSGLLCLLFFCLAKTPRGSKYLFGKEKGIHKGGFVAVCLIAIVLCANYAERSCDHVYMIVPDTSASTGETRWVQECVECGKEEPLPKP